MSNHLTRRLTLLAAIGSAVALVAHYAMLPPRPQLGAPPEQLMQFAGHQAILVGSAWLDGIGSVLLITCVLAIVQLSGEAGTMAGRVVQMAGVAVIAISLLTDLLLVGVAHAAAIGDSSTAATAYLLLNSSDYVYPVANAFWIPALGLIVLRSGVLPRGFGYVAVAFGLFELVGGLVALYSDTVNNVVNPAYMIMLAWIVAASVLLVIKPARAMSEPRVEELAPQS
jgi:hypothetical protein